MIDGQKGITEDAWWAKVSKKDLWSRPDGVLGRKLGTSQCYFRNEGGFLEF